LNPSAEDDFGVDLDLSFPSILRFISAEDADLKTEIRINPSIISKNSKFL